MENFRESIENYLSLCEHEKKLSPDTLKAYRIDLYQYIPFAEAAENELLGLRNYLKYLCVSQHLFRPVPVSSARIARTAPIQDPREMLN